VNLKKCYICDKYALGFNQTICNTCAKSYGLEPKVVVPEAVLIMEPDLTAQEAQLDLLPSNVYNCILKCNSKDSVNSIPVELGGF
jgi:hypothetical protein